MRASCDRKIIDPLEGIIVVEEGSIHRIAEAAEPVSERNAGNAPGRRRSIEYARHPQFRGDVPLVGGGRRRVAYQLVETETKFVDDGRSESPDVGQHDLIGRKSILLILICE